MKRLKKIALFAIVILSACYVAADLFCDDFKNCSGTAGCIGPGDYDGCELRCSGGGTIQCVTVHVY